MLSTLFLKFVSVCENCTEDGVGHCSRLTVAGGLERHEGRERNGSLYNIEKGSIRREKSLHYMRGKAENRMPGRKTDSTGKRISSSVNGGEWTIAINPDDSTEMTATG